MARSYVVVAGCIRRRGSAGLFQKPKRSLTSVRRIRRSQRSRSWVARACSGHTMAQPQLGEWPKPIVQQPHEKRGEEPKVITMLLWSCALCVIFMILVSLENVKKCVLGGCMITSKTKINVFWKKNLTRLVSSASGPLSSKFFQKRLTLASEANSAFCCENETKIMKITHSVELRSRERLRRRRKKKDSLLAWEFQPVNKPNGFF